MLDETHGFRQRGMIQFIGPQRRGRRSTALGDRPLYWLRARLKQGEATPAARCNGLWLNAVWASERRRIEREIAGRSDGNPGQSFQLRRAPVLAGEIVEVEEWVGPGRRLANALAGSATSATSASSAIRRRARPSPPGCGGASGRTSSHRARAIVTTCSSARRDVLRFGAFVPTAGRRIAVTYSSGGGIAGNVAAGAAKELRTAAPYLTGASNVHRGARRRRARDATP